MQTGFMKVGTKVTLVEKEGEKKKHLPGKPGLIYRQINKVEHMGYRVFYLGCQIKIRFHLTR